MLKLGRCGKRITYLKRRNCSKKQCTQQENPTELHSSDERRRNNHFCVEESLESYDQTKDGNFGNVSAGVLFSKVAYQRKRWWSYKSSTETHGNALLPCKKPIRAENQQTQCTSDSEPGNRTLRVPSPLLYTVFLRSLRGYKGRALFRWCSEAKF